MYIRPVPDAQIQDILDQITLLGGKVDGQGLGVIQAWVPIDVLETIADLPEVLYIRPPDYGVPNAGSETTEGDAVLGLDDVRQQFGIDGSGVRVGVFSTGLKGLEQSIVSGDLPATTFHCLDLFFLFVTLRPSGPCLAGERLVETSGGVTGRSFPANSDLAPDGEGTAMLEIIHDLAPGAELWFARASTTMDLLNMANFLAANVDIFVSDIGFPGFFPNGQNSVSQAIAQIIANPSNRARAYIQSIGNHADNHYSGLYVSSGINDGFSDFHLFSKNNETGGPDNPSTSNRITVPPFEGVIVFFTWDDPALASSNDYDLSLFDCGTGAFLDSSIETQDGTKEPLEIVVHANVSFLSQNVCYSIKNFLNRAVPRTLNVLIIVVDLFDFPLPGFDHEFNTRAKSLLVPADTTGDLIAVGAVPVSLPNQIESFSSLGPTFDGRDKPDVVAPNRVSVTGAGGFPSAGCAPDCFFGGTSAAAPHVAGLAALLLELDPTLTLSSLKTVLKDNANSLGLINGLATAVAVTPLLLVSPTTTVDFGSVAVGKTANRTFTVRNNRRGVLKGTASTSTPFSIVGSSSYSLAANASKNITVRFSPTSRATFLGNATFTGSSVTRQLKGVGIRGFTDDPLVAGTTPIKRVHITELRTAANETLGSFPFTDPTLTVGVTTVKGVHITDLRTALTQAAAALNKPAPSFPTDPTIVAGQTVIKKAHINDLRNAVKALD